MFVCVLVGDDGLTSENRRLFSGLFFFPPCNNSRRLIVISFFLAMWWERMLDVSHLCQLVSFVLIASLSLFKLVCVCACACLCDWMSFFFSAHSPLVKGRRWEQPQLVLISQQSNNNKATSKKQYEVKIRDEMDLRISETNQKKRRLKKGVFLSPSQRFLYSCSYALFAFPRRVC